MCIVYAPAGLHLPRIVNAACDSIIQSKRAGLHLLCTVDAACNTSRQVGRCKGSRSHLLQGHIGNRVPEGKGACQQLVHQHAHTPHVCLSVIPLQDDFRRHIHRCPRPGLQLSLIWPMPACWDIFYDSPLCGMNTSACA